MTNTAREQQPDQRDPGEVAAHPGEARAFLAGKRIGIALPMMGLVHRIRTPVTLPLTARNRNRRHS